MASDLDSDTLGSRLPRLTDKARTAFRLAVEQARAAGVPLVGTEHLLGGLLAEGSNLALPVLHALDIETGAVKAELDRAVAGSHPGGPDAGRRISGPLGTALLGAVAAANALGHNYIGCEHLLLGLISERDGAGGQILRGLGVDERQARRTVTASLAGIEYWQARVPRPRPGRRGRRQRACRLGDHRIGDHGDGACRSHQAGTPAVRGPAGQHRGAPIRATGWTAGVFLLAPHGARTAESVSLISHESGGSGIRIAQFQLQPLVEPQPSQT